MTEFRSLSEALRDSLPDVLWRSQWDKLRESHGLPYSKRTMANLDSQGRGPEFHKWNGRVYYLKEDVLEWLDYVGRSSPPPQSNTAAQTVTP